jgi:hypothetical protein
METIKILHLGNLCLLHGQSFSQHALLPRRTTLPLHADYLVVCGNITGDGSEAAFEVALGEINSIFEAFVTQRDHKENRLVIVPGRLDVKFGDNGEPDYTKFKDFLSKVYDRELTWDKLDPTTLTVRDTLDLTLISLPGVEVLGTGENKKTVFGKLRGQIERMRRRRPDYLNRTPNVLISAVPPIRVYKGELDNAAPDLTELFDWVRINVHLVGCAPRVVLPPADPFGNDPWCVSCDLMPAEAGEPPKTSASWPLRMNLIELPRTAANRPQVGAQAWHMRRMEGGDWETRRTLLAIEEEGTGQRPSMEKVYESLLKSLTTTLKEKRSLRGILVQGLPGCGLQKLHRWLEDREYLHGDVPVYSLSWKGKKPVFPYGKIAKWATRIPSDSLAVVAVWDPDLLSADSGVHEEHRAALTSFHDRFTDWARLRVLHLSHHTERGEELVADGFARVDMKALDSGAVETLGDLYALKVPVDAVQVNSFTGGYQGFTQGVLDYAQKKLGLGSRAQEVNTKTPWQLICASWSDDEIQKDFLRFVRRVSNEEVQWQVFDHIRRKLLASQPTEAAKVEFDLRDWRNMPDWADVNYLLQVLERFQIIEFNSLPLPRFHVRVVVPFLCQPVYRLFLSYEGSMRERASEFKEKLNAYGAKKYSILKIRDYGEKRDYDEGVPVPKQVQSIPAATKMDIKKAQNFCLYHSGRSSIESKWVKLELEFWHRLHPDKHPVIVADHFAAGGQPPQLMTYNIIDAREEDAIAKVFSALYSEEFDWSFWQEKIESFLDKNDN